MSNTATMPTRSADAGSRAPDRGMGDNSRKFADDPNVILNRHGQPIVLPTTTNDDRFDLSNMGIFPPDGWVYEWKTKFVKNWEWTDHQVDLAQRGWTPVPADRHDGKCMPKGFTGNIERGGLILMECPERAVVIARDRDKRAAYEPVKTSRQMAGMRPSGDVADYNDPSARGLNYVRGQRQALQDRGAQQYTYTVDE